MLLKVVQSVLDLGYSAITLVQGASLAITPQTLNYLGNNQTYETSGYSATISDVRLMSTFTGIGINTTAAQNANSSTTTLGTNVSTTVIGSQINLRATTVNTLFGSNTQLSATLTVVGWCLVHCLMVYSKVSHPNTRKYSRSLFIENNFAKS